MKSHAEYRHWLLAGASALLSLFVVIPTFLFAWPVAAAGTGTTNQKILILVHGSEAADTELALIKTPLDAWGYATEVFDYSEDYQLAHSSVGGDHWYLHYVSGSNGHGDLDLVTNGNMNYSVIIFGANGGDAFTDVETPDMLFKQMFQAYPFLGIVRMENGFTSGTDTGNLFQVGHAGQGSRILVVNNPTGGAALAPLVGYTRSLASSACAVLTEAGGVVNLENFVEGSPALTMATYPSGARAVYFAFGDWGYSQHVSMLIRVIQEYSGIPYKKPYYSFEVDDCGAPTVHGTTIVSNDYNDLISKTVTDLGGYPTLAFMGSYIDQNAPPNIKVWGQNPQNYYANADWHPGNASLLSSLKNTSEYVFAAHGYQHDVDWWTWVATGLPVAPYADQDGDGVANWLDSTIESGVGNHVNPRLLLGDYGAFADPNLPDQEMWFSRLRTLFDSLGYASSRVVIIPKFEYLDGFANTIAANNGFDVLSALDTNGRYWMTLGYVNGTYAPGRVQPASVGSSADVALDAAALKVFKSNFWTYVGNNPLSLITSHVWQWAQGTTPAYELRDSSFPAYQVMNSAGFRLLTTQSAANKNIGWLWTNMRSSKDASGNIALTFDATSFQDNKPRHELDIVMPYTVNNARLGSNYWINVDGRNIYFGKQSNTTEVLQTVGGTGYDASLPRISSVSTPATDVLNATYDSAARKVSLTLDGNFRTTVNIDRFNRPFSQGTTVINANGTLALTTDLTGEAAINSINMSVIPSSGTDSIAIDTWLTSLDRYKKWTEKGSADGLSVSHVVGDLIPGTQYTLKIDGAPYQNYTSDSLGQISFTCLVSSALGTFEIVPAQANSKVTLTSSANPSSPGQSVTFTANVTPIAPATGIPSGNVTFRDGSTTLSFTALNAAGQATFTTAGLTAGGHSVTVVYSGDGTFQTSTGTFGQIVRASSTTALTSSVNPSAVGQSVTFTAMVTAVPPATGTPGGTVTFRDGSTTLGTAALNASGRAVFTTAALTAGSHSLTAVYGGDGVFLTSTGTFGQTLRASAATALTSSVNPSAVGQSVTFTATVTAVPPATGIPGGTVTFRDGGVPLSTVTLNAAGQATFTTASLTVGGHSITAVYGGDAVFVTSTATFGQTVRGSTATALTSSVNPSAVGQSVTFTATVTAVPPATGMPGGTVTFRDGSTTLGTAVLDAAGHVTFSTNTLNSGSHSIAAVYGGDGAFGTSTGTFGQTVRASAATVLTSSANPSIPGQSVTFTAALTAVAPATGIPTGTVIFRDGSTTLGTAALNASGRAVFTTAVLAAGSHSIAAVYGGDGAFGTSTGTFGQTVRASSTIVLTSSANPSTPGQSVTFTATAAAVPPATGIPGGTVTFRDGSTTLGTAALNASGRAVFTTAALAAGSHSLTAVYGGDSVFGASTGSLVQTVQTASPPPPPPPPVVPPPPPVNPPPVILPPPAEPVAPPAPLVVAAVVVPTGNVTITGGGPAPAPQPAPVNALAPPVDPGAGAIGGGDSGAVNNVNRPPVLDPIGDRVVTSGVLLSFSVSANDPDGDALSFTASNLPAGATFDVANLVFDWIPTPGQSGDYSDVRFEVTDGRSSVSEDITITTLTRVSRRVSSTFWFAAVAVVLLGPAFIVLVVRRGRKTR